MIRYIKADATEPVRDNDTLIFHVCNDEGKWGAGFTGALNKKWREPEICYRAWSNAGQFSSTSGNNIFPAVIMRGTTFEEDNKIYKFELGNIQIVYVDKGLAVVNAVAQRGIRDYRVDPTTIHIDYEALETALIRAANFCRKFNYTLQMPKIGCGHAGGDWRTIEKIINKVTKNVDVIVCEY